MAIQLKTDRDIEAVLATRTAGRLLDIATGSGWVIGWLMEHMQDPVDAIGIDITVLDAATLNDDSIFNQDHVEYMQMDARDLEFADNSFDTVSISASLHHMADAETVLREAVRVLKPSGTLIVLEMYRDQQDGAQMTHILMHHWWANIDSANGIVHHETYTRQGLIDLVNSLGLSEITLMDTAFGVDVDPFDAKRREMLLNRIAHYLERAQDLPNYAEFETRANDIKLRLLNNGFLTANNLVAIGRK